MTDIDDRMIYAFAGEPEITAIDAHVIKVGLRAVLPLIEAKVREVAAAEIDAELTADQADDDVTSGEAIWEQQGYRRGLSVAAGITRSES